MSDFFKQLITQLAAIWAKLNPTQKVVIASTAAISVIGIAALVTWSSLTPGDKGYATLFVNLESGDAAQVTEAMKEMAVPYKLENNGRTLTVPQKDLYEVRMEMARQGLPREGGQGYELFDKLQLGMTDFVQNLNYQRALEGEITRSIETLNEVEKARLHIMIPKPSLFTEKQEEATASVVLKLRPGKDINEQQIRGITHLVASSVEGLKARQVAVLDIHGNLLTKGFADNALAEAADHNMTLTRAVETSLEKKVIDMFEGLLGPNKVRVKVAAQLNFEQVDKTVETYDPSSKVVRSQQLDDQTTKDSPVVGTEQKEGNITNFEMDRTVARIVNAPGTRERITVSLVVDGAWRTDKDGKRAFVPRTDEELSKFTALVKNAVGYRENGEDQVYVTQLQFDREFLDQEVNEMAKLERDDAIRYWSKIGVVAAIILIGFLLMRGLARNIAAAMNPPVPKYASIALETEEEEVPEEIQKQNELLERIEIITRDHPVNIAQLIRGWVGEKEAKEPARKGGKG